MKKNSLPVEMHKMASSVAPRGQPGPGDSREAPYRIVLNHENQYAIWPEARELPDGWQATSYVGTKAECLAYLQLSPPRARLAPIRGKAPAA
jgi:MbtH protein